MYIIVPYISYCNALPTHVSGWMAVWSGMQVFSDHYCLYNYNAHDVCTMYTLACLYKVLSHIMVAGWSNVHMQCLYVLACVTPPRPMLYHSCMYAYAITQLTDSAMYRAWDMIYVYTYTYICVFVCACTCVCRSVPPWSLTIMSGKLLWQELS